MRLFHTKSHVVLRQQKIGFLSAVVVWYVMTGAALAETAYLHQCRLSEECQYSKNGMACEDGDSSKKIFIYHEKDTEKLVGFWSDHSVEFVRLPNSFSFIGSQNVDVFVVTFTMDEKAVRMIEFQGIGELTSKKIFSCEVYP